MRWSLKSRLRSLPVLLSCIAPILQPCADHEHRGDGQETNDPVVEPKRADHSTETHAVPPMPRAFAPALPTSTQRPLTNGPRSFTTARIERPLARFVIVSTVPTNGTCAPPCKLLSQLPTPRGVLVWREGFDDWKAAENVREIVEKLIRPPPLPQRSSVPIPNAAPSLAVSVGEVSADKTKPPPLEGELDIVSRYQQQFGNVIPRIHSYN